MRDTLEVALSEEVRAELLARPDAVLEDRDVMRALIVANDAALGDNVVDMRGLAMQRLEERLDRLEDMHRSVVAAAYENLAGMEIIHRAALEVFACDTLEALLGLVDGPLAGVLRVDRTVLLLEAELDAPWAVPAGWIPTYLAAGSRAVPRRVTLRPTDGVLYGFAGSEACLALDLGPDRLPAMLALAVADPQHYHAGQGTDLLDFLAGAVERVLRRVA